VSVPRESRTSLVPATTGRAHAAYWGLLAACVLTAAAASPACNKPSETDATTSTKTTPGNMPLAPSSSTEPANPRHITMKGTAPGATVEGEPTVLIDGGAAVR
jgi:hypothetical protein